MTWWQPTLTIIRGLPGSGKSTLAKNLVNSDAYTEYFEADMYFISEDGTYEFDINHIADAHDWCRDEVYVALLAGENVIVSNTFTTMKELRPYFEVSLEITGKLPNVILCQGQFGSIHNVPAETMKRMKDRFDFHAVEKLTQEFGNSK